jgi:hypothetical protein
MKKRKSTRDPMVQTALWLPHDMHEQLKKDGGKRGLGDEIRRRLQMSFDDERLPREDQTTNEFLDQIKQLARLLSFDQPWFANRFAVDAFKAAINELLSDYQPTTEAQPKSMAEFRAMFRLGPDEQPETVGRILARVVAADMHVKRGNV